MRFQISEPSAIGEIPSEALAGTNTVPIGAESIKVALGTMHLGSVLKVTVSVY